MTILRSLIHRGIEINNKLRKNKYLDIQKYQYKTLRKLLFKSKNTEFGKKYSFDYILLSERKNERNLYSLYKKFIPIHDYSSIYKDWWSKGIKGESDIFCPGQVEYYALSSGTSEAASKQIPVSKQMFKAMQKASIRTIAPLIETKYGEQIFQHEILMIGGSTNLNFGESTQNGDLSGIQAAKLPFWFHTYYRPGKNIASIKDWNQRIDEMVSHAATWDIGIIVGVPSWVKMLLEKIIKQYKLQSIHDIWPNLFLYIHSGVSFEPYKNSFRNLFSKEVIYIETYLASEGFIANQTYPDTSGLQISLDSGIFYEFIPFNDTNFDLDGNVKENPETIELAMVKLNTPYAVLLTTCAGAWRYIIGDIVSFSAPEKLMILGRTKQFLNLCGEHISIDNLNNAILDASAVLNVEILEYSVAGISYSNAFAHVWFVGTHEHLDIDAIQLLHCIDYSLCNKNEDYEVERKAGQIQVFLYKIPNTYFYEFLELCGNIGGQNKVPRVLKSKKLIQWIDFLRTKKILPEIFNEVTM